MLKLLSISNLAVISHAQIEFGSGLNILSGETGAGKSIILSALGLLLGERASQELLRTGEVRAVVEGVFEIEGNTPLEMLLQAAGIDVEGSDLVIKREIVANGRGKVFVNNQSATLLLLKTIQPHIIDVHGQGEQQSLLSTTTQTNLLDAFAGTEALRDQIEKVYEQVDAEVKDWEESRRTEAERLQMLDLLGYQINEIESVSPQPEEDVELETERRLLVNAEKLATLCQEITQLLYDEDGAAVGRIGQAQRRLDDLSLLDESLASLGEQLNEAKYRLEDVTFAIRALAEKITYSPSRLQAIDERLSAIDRLKRKYGRTLMQVQDHLIAMKKKFHDFQHNEDREKDLLDRIGKGLDSYRQLAARLTKLRVAAGKELESLLKKDLSEVALEKAQFIIHFNTAEVGAGFSQLKQQFSDHFRESTFNRSGNEIAEVYFSANKGEDPHALAAVASGGELSRLMLILKTNIAPSPYPRTLVFDEIDTGIGGRVADAVGVRLKKLAKSNQVICVTHQAQIARYADIHLQVAKEVKGQRTVTQVQRLNEQQRVAELARMMAGSSVTAVTLEHAKELLQGNRMTGKPGRGSSCGNS